MRSCQYTYSYKALEHIKVRLQHCGCARLSSLVFSHLVLKNVDISIWIMREIVICLTICLGLVGLVQSILDVPFDLGFAYSCSSFMIE